MPVYTIVIDRTLCSGFGACAEAAPELIELGRDGIAYVRRGETNDPRVLEAADRCPMAAIAVHEAATGRQVA